MDIAFKAKSWKIKQNIEIKTGIKDVWLPDKILNLRINKYENLIVFSKF